MEELGELALRKEDDLEELLGGHAHEIPDLLVGLDDAGGLVLPVAGGGLLVETDGRLLLGEADSRLLRTVLLRLAGDPQAAAADGGLKLHLGRQAGGSMVGAEPLGGAPLPRHPAVEGERDRVEQRRLARAGLAVQQEQTLKVIEEDLLGRGERTEGLDPEPVRAHQRSPSLVSLAVSLAASLAASLATANALSSSSRSDGLASVFRTCLTNSAATARSSRPLTRSR